MSKIYIYLAGPVRGKTEDAAVGWRTDLGYILTAHNDNFVGVSPLRCELPGPDGTYPDDYSWKLAQSITAKNLLDVKRCDAVLAYLPDTESIGTMQEIGWAVGLGKTVIVMSSDQKILTHPILMATVPFLFDLQAGGLEAAIDTIDGLFGVYS